MRPPGFKPAQEVAEAVGVCERTIRRWHKAGHVQRKPVRKGLLVRWVYSLSDARRVVAGKAALKS